MKEFLSLMKLAWEHRAYHRELERVEKERLGGFGWYRSLRRAIRRSYRWKNPYMLSRAARRKIKLPESDLVFGETPILTAFDLLTEIGVDQVDHVIELGGGTSLFSLVAVSAFGSRATVLEIIPAFVKKTREIASMLGLERLKIRQGDILTETLPEGSLYYLTGTTFSEDSWKALQRRMAEAPVGAKAISLSMPLDSKAWKKEQMLTLPFSWGENTVYIQTRI